MVGIGGILPVALQGEEELAALVQHQVHQVVEEIGSGGDAVIGLPADAHLVQVVLESLLAPQLLDDLRHGPVHSGPVGLRQRYAMGLGHVLDVGVEAHGLLRLALGVLAEGHLALEGGVPVKRPVLVEELPIGAVEGVVHPQVILQGTAVVGHPVQVLLRGDGVAVHLHDRLLGVQTGDVVVDAGGRFALRAARAQPCGQDQGQQRAHPFFHRFPSSLFWIFLPSAICGTDTPGYHITFLRRIQSFYWRYAREMSRAKCRKK